jgi:hypothetical protein
MQMNILDLFILGPKGQSNICLSCIAAPKGLGVKLAERSEKQVS